jgi:thymidylate kinase
MSNIIEFTPKEKPPNFCWVVEGVDGVGKTTAINGLCHALSEKGVVGKVVHFGKPPSEQEVKDRYAEEFGLPEPTVKAYQKHVFWTFMTQIIPEELKSSTVILDRSHIGEFVYSQLYRGYVPEYLPELEERIDRTYNMRRILLVSENLNLRNDGNNFDYSRLAEEQQLFMDYFGKLVTDGRDAKIVATRFLNSKRFRHKYTIVREMLE